MLPLLFIGGLFRAVEDTFPDAAAVGKEVVEASAGEECNAEELKPGVAGVGGL